MSYRVLATILFLSQCFKDIELSSASNVSFKNASCFSPNKTECQAGILLPTWKPVNGISTLERSFRVIVYFVALCYLFLGVSIISDRFMASIEVITSKERVVKVKKADGSVDNVNVRIWNETVSNLTLMALGSSAPEILLSVIEICGKDFQAGELGPGTIVGSAAFNLFVIIGLCCLVIPNNEVRKIKHLGVFLITSAWSIFAYLWMYLILAQISVGVVEVWEALLTFAFFPMTVISAYIADTKIFFNKFLKRRFIRRQVQRFTTDGGDLDTKFRGSYRNSIEGGVGSNRFLKDAEDDNEHIELEKNRVEYLDIIRDIRRRQPNIPTKELEERAQLEVLNKGHKSRAFYRVQATRSFTGSGNVLRMSKLDISSSLELITIIEKTERNDGDVQYVYFDPVHYTVFENIGTMEVSVCRSGANVGSTFADVYYYTEDGTANAHDDYIPVSGKLTFQPSQTEAKIKITIIDDDIFEEDECFYVHLKNLVVRKNVSPYSLDIEPCNAQISSASTATIVILDDDHPGVFNFEFSKTSIAESIGILEIKVLRSSGARGHVRIPYKTVENTAIGGGRDYEDAVGYLDFQNDQTESVISIKIVDGTEYEKNKAFFLELGEPFVVKRSHEKFSIVEDIGDMIAAHRKSSKINHLKPIEAPPVEKKISDIEIKGQPRVGENYKIEVQICESKELKNVVDHLMRKGQIAKLLGTSSWREQFKDAFSLEADDENENEMHDSESNTENLTTTNNKGPSCFTYVMHYISLFWKVIFAFVPPTEIWGGWLCFIVSICVIGFLTAIIGDVASGFGCSVGLTDTVTAITFVALGTSLPDTFASKVAALSDPTADSSIGNVVGSNAVNVYLGIGIAWSIAACYHSYNGKRFNVSSGSLGFSVTLYCALAFVAITVMLLRRGPSIGGELGGPKKFKIATAFLFFSLWFIYILLSSLENYCHIRGF